MHLTHVSASLQPRSRFVRVTAGSHLHNHQVADTHTDMHNGRLVMLEEELYNKSELCRQLDSTRVTQTK